MNDGVRSPLKKACGSSTPCRYCGAIEGLNPDAACRMMALTSILSRVDCVIYVVVSRRFSGQVICPSAPAALVLEVRHGGLSRGGTSKGLKVVVFQVGDEFLHVVLEGRATFRVSPVVGCDLAILVKRTAVNAHRLKSRRDTA